eukprot:TRINITY_DN3956_c0_g1_i1.p1 TRINITY_DN3956_c0_g1~~TRINITY_DN3956_c0_g1_i1.p1  ORF type:complete len:659 (+),score=216.83 TRINITY_DN3956_c0_g1_i1:35-2011(+)
MEIEEVDMNQIAKMLNDHETERKIANMQITDEDMADPDLLAELESLENPTQSQPIQPRSQPSQPSQPSQQNTVKVQPQIQPKIQQNAANPVQTRPMAARQEAAQPKTDPKAELAKKQLPVIQDRLSDFQEALEIARDANGSAQLIKELTQQINHLKLSVRFVQTGSPIDLSELPVLPASIAQDDQLMSDDEEDSSIKIANQEKLVNYEILIKELSKLIKSVHEKAMAERDQGNKSAAVLLLRREKEYRVNLLAINQMKAHSLPIPKYRMESLITTKEFKNEHLNAEQIEIEFVKANALPQVGNAINPYAYLAFEYASTTPVQKVRSSVASNTYNPEWNSKVLVRFERKKSFSLFVTKRKIVIDVYSSRIMGAVTFFDTLLGKAEFSLKDLATKCELCLTSPIVVGKKKSSGQLQIIVRISHPLERPSEQRSFPEPHIVFPSPLPSAQDIEDYASRGQSLVSQSSSAADARASSVISQTQTPAKKRPLEDTVMMDEQSQKKAQYDQAPIPAPAPASVPAPAPAPTPKTPTSAPAAKAEEEEEELNNLDLIISNNVLEWESATTTKALLGAKAQKNTDLVEQLESRLQMIESKVMVLTTQVQTGVLTMEAYAEMITAKIQEDKARANQYIYRGMKQNAAAALQRVKLMEKELEEGDEEEE